MIKIMIIDNNDNNNTSDRQVVSDKWLPPMTVTLGSHPRSAYLSIYLSIYLSLSLSLYVYIYIYIDIDR